MNAPAFPLEAVSFRDFLPGDAIHICVQESQHICLGVNRPVLNIDDGLEMLLGGPAWTAIGRHGRVLCCAGFKMLWPPNPPLTRGHAIAWAILAPDLGAAHVAITHFAKERIAEAPYSRLETIVRMDVPTEYRWARLCGFRNPRVLRCWGPEGRPHILLERVN